MSISIYKHNVVFYYNGFKISWSELSSSGIRVLYGENGCDVTSQFTDDANSDVIGSLDNLVNIKNRIDQYVGMLDAIADGY